MAQCYRSQNKISQSKEMCLYCIYLRPNYTEAFITYLECLIYSNEWNSLEENKSNIISLAEYNKHLNNMPSAFNNLIADYMIHDDKIIFWLFENLMKKEIINIHQVFDEIPDYESKNKARKIEKEHQLKVGFLVNELKDEYTYNALKNIVFSNFRNIQNSKEFLLFLIIYENNSVDESNAENHNEEIYNIIKSNPSIIDLSQSEHPQNKADLLFSYQFDVIIFLENFVNDPYNDLNIKKIYQMFALRPAKVQIILPYNGITRGPSIFDFIILDKNIMKNVQRDLYKEKVIMFDKCSRIPKYIFYAENKNNDVAFQSLDIPEDSFILANFSSCYKINEEILLTWCSILTELEKSILVLKFNNEESSKNIKQKLNNLNIDEERIIFIQINEKFESAHYLPQVDLYLDVPALNDEFEVFLCLAFNIPVISLEYHFSYPVMSSFSSNILNSYSLRANRYSLPINFLKYKQISIEFPRDIREKNYKKNQMIKNRIVGFEVEERYYTRIYFSNFTNSIDKALTQIKRKLIIKPGELEDIIL